MSQQDLSEIDFEEELKDFNQESLKNDNKTHYEPLQTEKPKINRISINLRNSMGAIKKSSPQKIVVKNTKTSHESNNELSKDDILQPVPKFLFINENNNGISGGNAIKTVIENEPSNSALMKQKFPNRYFIIKNLTKNQLQVCIDHGYCTIPIAHKKKLHDAYQNAENVYLIFSKTETKQFLGYIRMISEPENFEFLPEEIVKLLNYDCDSNNFCVTKVEKQAMNNLPFELTKDLKNEFNNKSPVYYCREFQEIDSETAKKLCEMLENPPDIPENIGSNSVNSPPHETSPYEHIQHHTHTGFPNPYGNMRGAPSPFMPYPFMPFMPQVPDVSSVPLIGKLGLFPMVTDFSSFPFPGGYPLEKNSSSKSRSNSRKSRKKSKSRRKKSRSKNRSRSKSYDRRRKSVSKYSRRKRDNSRSRKIKRKSRSISKKKSNRSRSNRNKRSISNRSRSKDRKKKSIENKKKSNRHRISSSKSKSKSPKQEKRNKSKSKSKSPKSVKSIENNDFEKSIKNEENENSKKFSMDEEKNPFDEDFDLNAGDNTGSNIDELKNHINISNRDKSREKIRSKSREKYRSKSRKRKYSRSRYQKSRSNDRKYRSRSRDRRKNKSKDRNREKDNKKTKRRYSREKKSEKGLERNDKIKEKSLERKKNKSKEKIKNSREKEKSQKRKYSKDKNKESEDRRKSQDVNEDKNYQKPSSVKKIIERANIPKNIEKDKNIEETKIETLPLKQSISNRSIILNKNIKLTEKPTFKIELSQIKKNSEESDNIDDPDGKNDLREKITMKKQIKSSITNRIIKKKE